MLMKMNGKLKAKVMIKCLVKLLSTCALKKKLKPALMHLVSKVQPAFLKNIPSFGVLTMLMESVV